MATARVTIHALHREITDIPKDKWFELEHKLMTLLESRFAHALVEFGLLLDVWGRDCLRPRIEFVYTVMPGEKVEGFTDLIQEVIILVADAFGKIPNLELINAEQFIRF